MNNISKRLLNIANLVDKRIVADVGCDHGKLTNYLFENNKIDFAYISDISISSLNKAVKLLSNKNYKFESFCSNGFEKYTIQSLPQCIIAGMGGDEIINIISNNNINVESYILSPQHNIIDVKKFMINLGFYLSYDIIIEDNKKFYNIIKCDKNNFNQNEYTDFDLFFGKNNFIKPSKDFIEYIEYQKNKYINLQKIVSNEKRENIDKMLEYIAIAEKRIGLKNE